MRACVPRLGLGIPLRPRKAGTWFRMGVGREKVVVPLQYPPSTFNTLFVPMKEKATSASRSIQATLFSLLLRNDRARSAKLRGPSPEIRSHGAPGCRKAAEEVLGFGVEGTEVELGTNRSVNTGNEGG